MPRDGRVCHSLGRVATRLGQPSDAVELSHDGQTVAASRGEPLALSLIAADRLLWVWLYRIWPKALDAMALVKPATVID